MRGRFERKTAASSKGIAGPLEAFCANEQKLSAIDLMRMTRLMRRMAFGIILSSCISLKSDA